MVLAGLLWIAGVAAAVNAEFHRGAASLSRARALPGRPCPGLVVGVDSDLALIGKAARREAAVTAIHNVLGAQVVRVSLLWNQIEPVEGHFNWNRLDSVVTDLRAAGIEPVLTVAGSPPWANRAPASTPNTYLYVPRPGPAFNVWLQRYSSFLTAAVRRYHRFVRRWEIWSEPNLAANWGPRPDPGAYRQLYERLRTAILKVDPKAEVAVGGLADLTVARPPDLSGMAFLRGLIRAGTPISNVAVRPYTTNAHPPNIQLAGENNFDDIRRVHKLLLREGLFRASLWVTSWGWSSATVGRQRQAEYVDRSLTMIEIRYPFVRLATYAIDHDLPPRISDGLLSSNLEPKPAAFDFRGHADLAALRCQAQMALAPPPRPLRTGTQTPAENQ